MYLFLSSEHRARSCSLVWQLVSDSLLPPSRFTYSSSILDLLLSSFLVPNQHPALGMTLKIYPDIFRATVTLRETKKLNPGEGKVFSCHKAYFWLQYKKFADYFPTWTSIIIDKKVHTNIIFWKIMRIMDLGAGQKKKNTTKHPLLFSWRLEGFVSSKIGRGFGMNSVVSGVQGNRIDKVNVLLWKSNKRLSSVAISPYERKLDCNSLKDLYMYKDSVCM